MKNFVLKSSGVAALAAATALIVSGGNDKGNTTASSKLSDQVAERAHNITAADRIRPSFTAKNIPELFAYVQEMNQGFKGMSQDAIDAYAKKLRSLRLSKEEIKENWDILMQPISLDGRQGRFLVFLSNVNDHIGDIVSSADFIHENWEQLLALPEDPLVSKDQADKLQETLLDNFLGPRFHRGYSPKFGDPVLKNHLPELMKWHFDKVKTGKDNRRDPLGGWVQNSVNNGILSFTDIAPYIPLIEAELGNEWHDQHFSSVISLLENNNLIISDSDIVTRFHLKNGTLRQPAADEPLVFNFGGN